VEAIEFSGAGDDSVTLRRARSCSRLDALLTGLRGGESQVLVVRGEMGVGKTALLEDLADRATGCHVAQATSVWSEAELAFAGLHQLCGPFLDRRPDLPAPQAAAPATVFGLDSGAIPDRFMAGPAVLTLLSTVAEERPLLWLDPPSAQALAFAARRLMAERVALVFGVRDPSDDNELGSFSELVLDGLGEDDARALPDAGLAGPLDARVRDRIVAETHGNPLALLELPRTMSPDELAGDFGFPGTRAMFGRIEESYLRRLGRLPEDTRRLLLVAAAEPLGDPVVGRGAGGVPGLWPLSHHGTGERFRAADRAIAAGRDDVAVLHRAGCDGDDDRETVRVGARAGHGARGARVRRGGVLESGRVAREPATAHARGRRVRGGGAVFARGTGRHPPACRCPA
jgi:hypothetical protein